MKSVVVLHTVRSVIEPFEARLKAAMPSLTVYNLLDEFLAMDANRRGVFSSDNEERLRILVNAASLTRADGLVCTCSTLSTRLIALRGNYSMPIIPIDEGMIEEAVRAGSPLTILATAPSAINPLREGLAAAASASGKSIAIDTLVCEEAFCALRERGLEAHDQLLLAFARTAAPTGVILLAQASMAHLAETLSGIFQKPVMSAPESCVRAVQKTLARE